MRHFLMTVLMQPRQNHPLPARGESLPAKNKDHELTEEWAGHRECHIQPDWLLIYRIEDDILVLTLARTGTHSDLFAH